ncbi:MAG: hypothetical protein ACYDCL_18290 [Myxococcales bacterium]
MDHRDGLREGHRRPAAARARSTLRLAATALLLTGCASNTASSPTTSGNVTGLWQGAMSYRGASRPIGFTLADDGGVISGSETLYDPVSQAVAATIPLSGADDGGNAQWSTLGHGFIVAGTFVGENFKGSITMPDIDGGSLQASIALSRADGGAP